jgi:hypothetical protein
MFCYYDCINCSGNVFCFVPMLICILSAFLHFGIPQKEEPYEHTLHLSTTWFHYTVPHEIRPNWNEGNTNPFEKRPLGRRRTWKDNIKMNIRNMAAGCEVHRRNNINVSFRSHLPQSFQQNIGIFPSRSAVKSGTIRNPRLRSRSSSPGRVKNFSLPYVV